MADRARQESTLAAFHVAVLAAFAVSQPLFELVNRHVEFLVAHQVDGLDIACIAAAVGFGPPAGFGLMAWLGSKLPDVGSRMLTWCLTAGLIAAIALPGFELLGDTAGLEFAAAAALGIAGATVYLRLAAVRTFATFLTPALLLFPALFVWNVAEIASESDDRWRSIAARSATPGSDAPVVVVVFDALPLSSLLDDAGSIDAVRHPHFAALAARSNWYFDATTVAERTTYALPAILTGQYPDQNRVATAAEYPQNLFTVLSKARSLHVIEPFTRLCPQQLCGSTQRRERLESIASDLVVIYLNRLLPDGASESLPDVTGTWKNFAITSPGDEIRHRRADASWIFDRFIERIVDSAAEEDASTLPPLHFIHINLPHRPYRYLPSGTEYGPIGSFGGAHGAGKGVWRDDEWEVAQALQRHLLQLRYADTLLGRLMQRLEQVGIFDEALIVVTADHGISFRAGGGMRQVDRKHPLRNAGDILRVPLFFKLPGQTEPVRSDRNVETIDILPTIVDVLGGQLPEPVDGVSALRADSAATRTDKVVYVRHQAGRMALRVAATVPLGDPVLGRLGTSAAAGLFAIGPRSELHGRPSSSLAMLARSGFRLRLIDASAYDDVDLESPFVPAHVTGVIFFAEERGPQELAVVINGVIRATTRTYPAAGPERARFTAMVPPDVFRPGANTVEIFVIRERAGEIALEPTQRLSAIDYFGVPGIDGKIRAIGASDGRIYPLLSHAVVGKVTHSGAYFEGEAVDARRDRAAEWLLVFAGGELLHVQPLASARFSEGQGEMKGTAEWKGSDEPSLVSSLDSPLEPPRQRRFRFAIPFGKLGGDTAAHVQFVGLSRDAASRLRYPSGAADSTEPSWLGPTARLELVRRGDRDGLAMGKSWIPIDPSGATGGIEVSRSGQATLSGRVVEDQRLPAALLVFDGGQLAVAVAIDPAQSYFELELPGDDASGTRFIVASADGTAAELEYSPSP